MRSPGPVRGRKAGLFTSHPDVAAQVCGLVAATALALSSPAFAVDNTAAGYTGAASGNWSGGGSNVIGLPDDSCANMGAQGKANFLSNFGFSIPGSATITGLTAFAKAGASSDQVVIFQLASDVTVPTLIGAPQNATIPGAGGGSCASTVGLQYPATDNNNLGGWGLVSIAPATVNATNFGIGLTTNSNGTVKFDSLCLQVAYTTDSGPAAQQLCLTDDAQPQLALDKTSPTADYDSVGDVLSYAYLVSSTGTAGVPFPISVSDNRAVVTCPADDGGAPNNGDAVLDPGESITCSASYAVVQADLNAGSVTNTATASGDDGTLSNEDSVTINAIQNPLMTVVKSSPIGQVTEPGNVSYSYLVTNTGNVTLTAIALSDDNDNDDLSCPSTSLAPAGNMTCTATHTVTQAEINQDGSPTPDTGFLSNTVTATSGEAPTVQDSLDIPIVQNRSLAVTKSGIWNDDGSTDNIAEVGETVTYTISVLNDGNTDEILIDVTDPLITGAPNNGTISCPGGNPIPLLEVGDPAVECTGTYTLVLADINAGQVGNTATATSFGGATDDGSETVSLPSALGLSLVKSGTFNDDITGDTFAEAGETIGYTFDVTNDSSVTVTNISVTDPKIATITCPGGNPIPSLGPSPATVQCTGSYTLTQTDVNAGQVDNTATASSADVPQPATDDETVDLVQNIDWTITKNGVFQDESGDGFAQVGETIEYTLSVANTGFVTLTNVSVSDPLVTPINCPGGNPIPSVAPGATVDCTGTYSITQADINAGQVVNTGTGNPDESPPEDAESTLAIEANAEMTIQKLSGTTEVSGPGPVLYSYIVTNTGDVTLTGIALDDDNDDDDLSCPSDSLEPDEQMLCTATRTVIQDDIDANGSPTADSGLLQNTVTGTADQLGETEVTAELDIDIVYAPEMTVQKDSTTAEVTGEGVVSYTYLVTNTGNVTLTGIALVDDNVDGPVDCGGVTELAPDGELLCSAERTVTQQDLEDDGSPTPGSGELFNQVTASSNEAEDATADLAIPLNYLGLLNVLVTKDFSDDNPAEVEVRLTCNTGQPLVQPFTISEGNPVNFVVELFEPGTMDCRVEEISEGSTGYTTTYSASAIEGTADAIRSEPDGCYYDLVQGGSFACELTNTLDAVEVAVSKEWVGDIGQIEAVTGLLASASYSCYDVLDAPDGTPGSVGGALYFEGASSVRTIGGLYPWWDGNPRCVVSEGTVDSSVEADDSDCALVALAPGAGGACTIVNTMFFEGIPSLNRYGLALLALLMLGVGLVGFRRFA